MWKLGLVSVSFRQHSPEEIAKAAAEAELKIIEWGSDIHAPCKDIERLKEIAKLQKTYGIESCTYGTYFRIGVNKVEEIYDYIAAAKILEAPILRIWCGDKASSEYSTEEKVEILKESKELAKIAECEGVKLCLEFHNHTYSDTLHSARELIEKVNSPAFRTYWQPNQYCTFETNLTSAKWLAQYVEHIHVFNWEGFSRMPLIEAEEKWHKYLHTIGGDHPLMLEFMPDDRIESLMVETEALKKIVEGMR